MAQDTRPCMGCGELIYRTVAVAPIRHYCTPDCRPRCSIDGCEKVRHGNVYCGAHHTRWKRTGDPLTPLERQHNIGECGAEGCDQPMRKTGWCASHYQQQKTTGKPPGPFKYKWGDGGYVSTHRWLRRRLGPPADHVCVDCGDPAAEWSYEHTDPDELVETSKGPYSRNPEHYSPRCVLCHRRFDRQYHRSKP